MAERPRSLRARIALGLLAYALLLGFAVGVVGYVVVEAAERTVWSSLLSAEMDRIAIRRNVASEPASMQTGTMRLHARSHAESLAATVPLALERLEPGLYEDVLLDERELVVLVRDVGRERLYLELDITELELRERYLASLVALLALLASSVLVAAAWFFSGRLLRPLYRLADAVHRLRPERPVASMGSLAGGSRELQTIAHALDDYILRQASFVQRERDFIDSVSHELRTPIAVIAGAAELAAHRPELPASAAAPLRRILHTAHGAEQLITMLLVLARDPARLREAEDRVRLQELLPDIVDDHRHLTEGKSLDLHLGVIEPSTVAAPLQVLQVAIGNLLRNALESSDRGRVDVWVQPAGVVRIRDPGHGMSPEEIARLYVAAARGGDARLGPGIGLELIRRIGEHLGWKIELSALDGRGTLAVLDLRACLVEADKSERQ